MPEDDFDERDMDEFAQELGFELLKIA